MAFRPGFADSDSAGSAESVDSAESVGSAESVDSTGPELRVSLCYALLQLDHDAALSIAYDDDKIRHAYRRGLLVCHPDKGGSIESHAALTAAFEAASRHAAALRAAISDGVDLDVEAWAMDAEVCRLLDTAAQHPLLGAIAMLMLYLASQASGGRAPSLRVALAVTLQDVYAGVTKKVTLRVPRLCPPQRRLGNSQRNGLGDPEDLDGLDGLEADLPGPAGWTTQRVVVVVPISVEAVRDGEYVFEGAGQDSLFDGFARGDINVRIELQPHPVYELDQVVNPHDVHANVSVSVRDYYYGRRMSLPPLDAAEPPLEVSYEGRCKERVQVFRGRGMPLPTTSQVTQVVGDQTHGDLYVFFNVELPAIPQSTLDKVHVRMFFEMLFGALL